ncbi:MAG: hypothetical protein HUU08_15375 [Candidatus Brocadia sp.]|nr:hypothetical protein [Candidatus Brocadia sp.]
MILIPCVVIEDVTVETREGLKKLRAGVVVKISEKSADQLIETDKIKPLPYITDFGCLIIPYNSPIRYHWWNGGQSVVNTLFELGASCEVLAKYR